MPKIEPAKIIRIVRLATLRLSAVGLQLLVQLLVGRFTGGYGLGLLQIFTTWTCVLGEMLALGLPTRAMRNLSSIPAEESIARWKFVSRCMLLIIALWFAMLTVAGLAYASGSQLMSAWIPGTEDRLLWTILFSALAFAQLRLMSDILKALGHTDLAVGGESAGPPLTLLISAAVCLQFLPLEPYFLILSYAAGMAVTAAYFFCKKIYPMARQARLQSTEFSKLAVGSKSELPRSELSRVKIDGELFAFAGTGLLNILFISFPFIILPHVTSINEAGVFALAFKLVNLIATILIMLAAIYGPEFARAAQRNDVEALRSLLFKTQWVSCSLYIPAMLTLIFFNQPLLQTFGQEFLSAEPFILLLLIGQSFNAVTGLPGVMLNMTEGGKLELNCALLGILTAVLLCVVFRDGLDALAIAAIFSAATAVKNLASYFVARGHISKLSFNFSKATA